MLSSVTAWEQGYTEEGAANKSLAALVARVNALGGEIVSYTLAARPSSELADFWVCLSTAIIKLEPSSLVARAILSVGAETGLNPNAGRSWPESVNEKGVGPEMRLVKFIRD